MPKGNRTPRRRPPFQIQLALIGDRLRQIHETGRLTISFEWDRKISHEQTVRSFTQLDNEIRYRLGRQDQFEREEKAREMLITKRPRRTRAHTVGFVSKATGLSRHRVRELRRLLRREAQGKPSEDPTLDPHALPTPLDSLSRFPGFAVFPTSERVKK